MSVAVLVSGSLFKEPQQRTSQSGKRYVVATIKAAAADSATSDFWSVLAFGDTAGAELMRLAVGERVTIQGSMKVELYTAASDGKTKISRTVFADHVMALRQPPKERKPKAPPAGSKAADSIVKQSILPDATPEKETAAGGPAFFDDEIPFGPAR
jgi:single-stranded DNA-binding protein